MAFPSAGGLSIGGRKGGKWKETGRSLTAKLARSETQWTGCEQDGWPESLV